MNGSEAPNWIVALVAIAWGGGIGSFLLLNPRRVAKAVDSSAEHMNYPKGVRRLYTPGLMQLTGIGFILLGIAAAITAVFFPGTL